MLKNYALAVATLLIATHGFAQPSFTDGTTILGHMAHSGGCMAVTDMDDDGLDDVIQLDNSNHVHVLYQETDGSFTDYDYGVVDTGSQWGWAIGDLDNDGFKDICSGSYGQTHFLSITARGVSTLTDLDGPSIFTQNMSMGDMNNDGRVDVFACHDNGHPNIWFTNTSGVPINNNAYIDWTTVSNMPAGDMSGNYGSCFTDFDNDGDLDLYISHCRQGVNDPGDARRWNRLFVNDGTNNYSDQAATYGVQDHDQTWTTDFGDYDNDGDLDMVSTEHSTTIKLFQNDGTGHFTEVTAGSGLDGTTGFMLQGLFRDLDNDGHLDILIAGGIERYFKGNGDGTFTQVNGLFPSSVAMHGFAFGDLNRDGFEDVYANYGSNYVDPGSTADRLWLNTPNGNHFFRVRLEGTVSNRDAIGAKVTITGPWGTQVREVRSGESYGLVNSFILSFGLGAATVVPTMTIHWPSGSTETFTNLHADQTMTVVEGTCISPNIDIAASPSEVICTGDGPITLTADAGYSYTWNTGATTQSISVSTPGAYWTVVNGTGDCVTQANVNVLLNPDQTPTVEHIGNGNICSQDQLVLTSSSPENNLWSTGSTEQSITVSTAGTYSVTVQGACADFTSDPVTVTVFDTPAQPQTTDAVIPVPGTAVISAAGDSIAWYDSQTGGTLLGTGSPWTTPFVSVSTPFWAADVAHFGSDPVHGGKVDKSASSGGYQNNANYYLLFNTTQDMLIHSVKVYANGAGNRQIGIIDQSSGDVVASGTYSIPDGESVVVLDLTAPGGGAYGLRVMAGDPELWRDAVGSNPVFPYDLGGLGSITGSNAGSDQYYYFFYDWEVSSPGTNCPSPRSSAMVWIGQVGIHEQAGAGDLQVFPNPASDELTLLGDLPAGQVDLAVLDVAGRAVMSRRFDQVSRTVDVSGLAPGPYTLRIRSTTGVGTVRFVKQ